eukprot:CAMPEP_0204264216 /NCGR_PEP_ID=MMETSP0468-20130131/8869_1 /ASSEMBLY_ACC=CAM_ASM_000383 /TAXON_ID=2969 /ORGANISM="Oxyrrhis marina" /LENGTH=158 /DNA_ID=CAMNT_0051239061 /DNA_START=92 /DNA_END=566 /DNA_ORIENTATION=-
MDGAQAHQLQRGPTHGIPPVASRAKIPSSPPSPPQAAGRVALWNFLSTGAGDRMPPMAAARVMPAVRGSSTRATLFAIVLRWAAWVKLPKTGLQHGVGPGTAGVTTSSLSAIPPPASAATPSHKHSSTEAHPIGAVPGDKRPTTDAGGAGETHRADAQ